MIEGVTVDRKLVEAARSGDEEAFASIARGSADRLFSVAYRILRDVERAQDAVQQALVSAWRQLPTLRDVDRFDCVATPATGECLLRRGQPSPQVERQHPRLAAR